MHHFLLCRKEKEAPVCIPEVAALQRRSSEKKRIKQSKEKEMKKGSVLLRRAGILEAVFEEGEECSARGRMSAGEERGTSTVQGMKGLEKQSGIKLCKMCWAGSGPAQ